MVRSASTSPRVSRRGSKKSRRLSQRQSGAGIFDNLKAKFETRREQKQLNTEVKNVEAVATQLKTAMSVLADKFITPPASSDPTQRYYVLREFLFQSYANVASCFEACGIDGAKVEVKSFVDLVHVSKGFQPGGLRKLDVYDGQRLDFLAPDALKLEQDLDVNTLEKPVRKFRNNAKLIEIAKKALKMLDEVAKVYSTSLRKVSTWKKTEQLDRNVQAIADVIRRLEGQDPENGIKSARFQTPAAFHKYIKENVGAYLTPAVVMDDIVDMNSLFRNIDDGVKQVSTAYTGNSNPMLNVMKEPVPLSIVPLVRPSSPFASSNTSGVGVFSPSLQSEAQALGARSSQSTDVDMSSEFSMHDNPISDGGTARKQQRKSRRSKQRKSQRKSRQQRK